jgi:hypothetical protein
MLEESRATDVPRVRQNEAAVFVKIANIARFLAVVTLIGISLIRG